MFRAASLVSWVALAPAFAFAQEGESKPAEAAPTGQPTEEKTTEAPAAPSDQFTIRRGFFAESDLGIFLTFGGRNTNQPGFPSRGTSNIQPHLGLVVGYDLLTMPTFNLSFGVRLAMGLSGGAGRLTAADIPELGDLAGTRSNDFTVIETGGQVGLSFLVTDRLAIAAKLDGGMGIIDPDPTAVASEANAGKATFAPVVGAGAGIEYFTLLNDFSVGVTLRFMGVLLDGMIPGATVTIPIKYTF